VVEDSPADATLIRRALTRAGIGATMHEVDDGEKAMQFFEAADRDPSAPCPDLVLLDVNLPRFKGAEVLQHLRASVRCRACAVLVVSSSDSPRDREEMDRLGANGYFRKPSEFEEFMQLAGSCSGCSTSAARNLNSCSDFDVKTSG
jgi:CheY-like chemotaxis protein